MSNLSLVKRAFTQIPSNHRKKHFKRCRYQFSDKFEIFAHMIHYGYILQAMEALQRFPAIAKKRSRYGETLLDFACVNGDANLIRLLIRLGANVNHVNSVGLIRVKFRYVIIPFLHFKRCLNFHY